jgi:amino acid adenylation domain-containing protein
VLDAYARQDVPFERIVEDLGLAGSAGHSPLFQVVFVLEEAGGDGPGEPFDGPALAVPTHTSRFDLTLILRRDGGSVTGGLEYSRDLFDEATARRLAGQYRTLLSALVGGPDEPVDRLAVMTADEVECEVRTWNATGRRLPDEGCLHRLVEGWARRAPDRAAVAAGPAGSLTYAELDRAAAELAGRLVRLGAGPERLVAVRLDRSPELVVALLAIWKAGAAYLPLDPDHPDAWLDRVVADAGPIALLTPAGLRGLPHTPGVAGAAGAEPGPLNVACVLYTSGSTGQPKGVALTHRAVANVVHQRNAVHAVSGEDRVLQSFSPAFDPSIWQVFGPLVAGATVVLPEPGRHRDLQHLVDVVERERVTIFDSTPSLLASLLDLPDLARAFATVRTVFCGGEPLANDLNDRFLDRTGCRLTAIYGITEACVDVTSWACRPMGAPGSVPIGRPVANKRAHVLDRHLAPVPVGVPGELYVGGPALARGYTGRPDLTAAAFVPDPLSGEPGARLYRTGDLGRRLPGGDLEFLGRRDEQVKLRGHRVEAGQVEHALREHPAVAQAVAAVVADGQAEPRLVAYVVPAGPAPERQELVAHLRARLPAFMVPAAFVVVDALPLTDTGKVDRRRLPAPRPPAGPEAGGSTQTEAAIAAIWREVLGIDTVAVTDDFFDVGGHSLTATRMLARVEETLGVAIPVRVLLVDSTVAALAAAVERSGRE